MLVFGMAPGSTPIDTPERPKTIGSIVYQRLLGFNPLPETFWA